MEKFNIFISAKEYSLAAEVLLQFDPQIAAQILESMENEDFLALLRELDSVFTASMIPFLSGEKVDLLVNGLNYGELENIFSEMDPEEKAKIIRKLSPQSAVRILAPEDLPVLLREMKYAQLKPLLAEMNAVDAARALEQVKEEAIKSFALFRHQANRQTTLIL